VSHHAQPHAVSIAAEATLAAGPDAVAGRGCAF
jgi:hypothetical protein